MKLDLPVWRSLMYVPVNVEKFIEKAHTRGTDVIPLDQIVTELEEKRGMSVGHTKCLVMIETTDAFSRIDGIPRASPRRWAC